eukprot:37001-Amphidinium_carterae.1
MAHCFHSSQFGFLRDRYITQAIGQLEQGAMAAAASNPFAAVLFCDLRALSFADDLAYLLISKVAGACGDIGDVLYVLGNSVQANLEFLPHACPTQAAWKMSKFTLSKSLNLGCLEMYRGKPCFEGREQLTSHVKRTGQ